MGDNLTTEEVFNSAVSIVRNLPKEGPIKPSDELKLKLYAYFKQATHGPNDTPKPRFYQITEAYKWDAWRKLGDMIKEDAMLNYISELKQIMESISEKEAQEDTKHFEDVLGKKFYDYWFNQWKKSGYRKKLASTKSDEDKESSQENRTAESNDAQSNSSRDSSMSMLEETQSAGDGYKTPNSLAFKETFMGEVTNQFALAVLRLQHDLDETITRLNKIEDQLKQSMNSINLLEEQTHIKQSSVDISMRSNFLRSNSLINLLRNIKTVHLFYLTYPLMVYFIIRAFERRDRNYPR